MASPEQLEDEARQPLLPNSTRHQVGTTVSYCLCSKFYLYILQAQAGCLAPKRPAVLIILVNLRLLLTVKLNRFVNCTVLRKARAWCM